MMSVSLSLGLERMGGHPRHYLILWKASAKFRGPLESLSHLLDGLKKLFAPLR